jgi:hypothetical protein
VSLRSYDEADTLKFEGTLDHVCELVVIQNSENLELVQNTNVTQIKSIMRQARSASCNTRYTQTTISLPMLKKVIITEDGLCWVINDSAAEYCRPSPEDVINLTESDLDIRVCPCLSFA